MYDVMLTFLDDLCLNVSTTPIKAMGCQQCSPLSVVQLKGKHCRRPCCCNGVVDKFWLWKEINTHKFRVCHIAYTRLLPFISQLPKTNLFKFYTYLLIQKRPVCSFLSFASRCFGIMNRESIFFFKFSWDGKSVNG